MAVYLGLVEDEDDGYDEFDDPTYRDEVEDPRVRRYVADDPRPEAAAVVRRAEPRRTATMERPAVRTAVEAYRITTLQPRSYNDARAIGEQFREGVPVIMNLTEMDDGDAKRLVDFAAGLIFGLRGSIERVTNKVFLLSPYNVEVTAEDKARIAEGGFFNQS
jgi:cell division inhibitor SepF